MFDIKLIKSIVKGAISFIPGVFSSKRKDGMGSNHSGSSAEFCYSLWLSILVFLHESGQKINLSEVGEIGNGGSFGVGICAILTGSKKYFALEVESKFNIIQNLTLLNEIVVLFRRKAPITKFSQINIKINKFEYPELLIDNNLITENLIQILRNDITSEFVKSEKLFFIKDWTKKEPLHLNFIFSRAVMEHVKDPFEVHNGVFNHLIDNGFVLHDIEFHSHGITSNPIGHKDISDFIWKIIFGKRDYFINRLNLDSHLSLVADLGFELQKTQKTELSNKINEAPIIYGAVFYARKVKIKFPPTK